MNVFLFKLFSVLLVLALLFVAWVAFALVVTSSDMSSKDLVVSLVGASIIFGMPLLILWRIRTYYAKKFEVGKYRSEKHYHKTMQRIQKSAEHERDILSDQSAKKNIDPLIVALRKEIDTRRSHMTPHILERTRTLINRYREENKLLEVNTIYELIISTKLDELNSKMSEYIKAQG